MNAEILKKLLFSHRLITSKFDPLERFTKSFLLFSKRFFIFDVLRQLFKIRLLNFYYD